MVHRNFESTEEMVNNLLKMESKLNDIERMLASDSEEILGPAPNLLTIHYQLNQLEQFRNQTMHRAKKAKQSSLRTLEKSFGRLNSVIAAFDQYILELARNVLNLIRAGQPDVVVKLIKVAELEGREDEKVSKMFSMLQISLCLLSMIQTGSGPQICPESCQSGCRTQVQVLGSYCSCPQTLSFKDRQSNHRIHPS